MNSGEGAGLVYLILLLVLVGSGLAARRIPMRQSLKMALAWVLIFAILFVIVALRDDFAALGRRVVQAARGDAAPVQQGETVRIRQSEDGHFWVDAELNGQKVRFLIDSGATVTALSAETARRAGVEAGGGFPVAVDTANGTIMVKRGSADRIEVGSIVRTDLPVHVSDALGDTDLLGMNFLSTLSGWSIEGRWLILRP